MFGFFKKQQGFMEVIESVEIFVFQKTGVSSTPALSIRFRTAFALALCGVLNEMGGDRFRRAIDKLFTDVRDSIRRQTADLKTLSQTPSELEQLLKYFPIEVRDGQNFRVDGATFFDAYSRAFGQALVEEIVDKSSGPFGSLGYAMSIIARSTFPEDKQKSAGGTLVMLGPHVMKELLPIVKRHS